jgi:hypothetical protein
MGGSSGGRVSPLDHCEASTIHGERNSNADLKNLDQQEYSILSSRFDTSDASDSL